jgi:hypothetical protein
VLAIFECFFKCCCRRQDFEYLLKRRRSLKEDYLRYIDYETKLEALRQNRKQVLVKQLQVGLVSVFEYVSRAGHSSGLALSDKKQSLLTA